MADAPGIFWDKVIAKAGVKKILKDESHPRFMEFAALLLSRNNNPKEVFSDYISKEFFCRNWAKIKRRMRLNKWGDTRIIFWDEVYQVVRKRMPKGMRIIPAGRNLHIDPEIKSMCAGLRAARKNKGLTQEGLAEKTGLSQQSISFAEQGYVNISLRTLKKIADAVDLSLSLQPAKKRV